MIRLFLLYAILIFAKRAPKLITDLLNIKSENVGLKGLSIKNKMGEAAIVGDKVKKGMTAVEGGLKKSAGASRQLLKNALINPNGLAGKIGGDIKKGWKDGWDGGKGFFGKLGGAISNTAKEGKKSVWDNRKDNLKQYKGELRGELIDKSKDNAKKVVGNLAQGLNDYRKKEDTKGAYTSGRKNVDVNFMTTKEGFEKFAGDTTRGIAKWAGLDDEKAAKNRYDRSVLGMNTEGEAGGKKIKIDDEFRKTFGAVFSELKDEHGNPIKDERGNSQYIFDAEALDTFKKSDVFKSWDREKQLTFEKYTNNQARDDLSAYKQGAEQLIQISQALATANQANAAYNAAEQKMKTEHPGYSPEQIAEALKGVGMSKVDVSELINQQNALNETMEQIRRKKYTYNDNDLSITNIDSALTKINEDISKNSSDLAELKASEKPKENK